MPTRAWGQRAVLTACKSLRLDLTPGTWWQGRCQTGLQKTVWRVGSWGGFSYSIGKKTGLLLNLTGIDLHEAGK